MTIQIQKISDVIAVGPLPKATLYEIMDELEARAAALESSGADGIGIAYYIRYAVDSLRIAAAECVAQAKALAEGAS